MTKITYIPGEIANAAIDEHGNRKPVTRTQHIFDDAKSKSQAEVNADIDDTLALHQSEINALNNQNYVTVNSFNALPATGASDTVYRVSNWDGTQQDPTVYSEYAWNGSQYVHLSTKTQIGEVFDISAYHATGSTLAKYDDLATALDSNNGGGVPQSLQKGGMSVKYVSSSDNKYVQYRLTANEFTTDITKWQNVGDFLEEKEISYSEEDVAGYITDKRGAIIGKLMKSGAVEWTVKNSRDILLDGKISDIEESIQGISGNLSTQTERIDELDENVIREVEIDDAEEDVAAYITDRNGALLAKILKDGSIERTVRNESDKIIDTLVSKVNELFGNTLEETVVDISDDSIAGYITDKNKAILAKINKDGSIDRIVENDLDKHTVHFEDVNIDGIVNLLADKKNNVIASINNKAEVDFYGGGGFAGEKIVEAKTWGYNKLIVSKNNIIIGGIKPDGTVKIFKAEIDDLNHEDVNVTALIKSLPIIASGLDNVAISNDKRIMNLLTSVNSTKIMEVEGVDIKSKLNPVISIIDDDTIDGQIPSSFGSSSPTNFGGYFSVLLPLMLSLNDKYGIDAKVGLACEGHRVGLTSFLQPNDNYSQLNDNGNCVKLLNTKVGWDILNHSMTAQLPANTYGVDSINSALADQILSEGTYVGDLSFQNTIVLDKSTGKWYEVNSTKTAWVERTPTKKYAMQYYRDYGTNNYHINRDFDFDYSWGEWYRRAKELGLPYKSCIVYNGSSTSPFTIAASRKYAEYGVRTTLDRANIPPIPAAVARYSIVHSSENNAEAPSYLAKMKSLVDECYSMHSWLVWMSHANNNSLQNRYVTGVDYGSKKDNNYSSEWEIPLNASEITTMDANNYWVNPPARLGISRWKDWHPAPGTQIGAFYEVLEYAINKGVDIVTPTEGWRTHGNLMQIGVDMMDTHAIYNIVDDYTDAEQSFLTVGADGSIRYFSK